MNRNDYLRLALKAGLYKSRPWLISAFSLIKEAPDEHMRRSYFGRIAQLPTGMFFINEEAKLEKIEDAKPGVPLFTFKDVIQADAEICPNIVDPITTTIGQVIVNLAVLVQAFGKRFPFVTGRIKVGDLEKKIAAKLKDTPAPGEQRDPNFYYVDEYVTFSNSLSFLAGLSQLCVWANTEKNITAPTGIEEFKQQLLKKYEGKLHDAVELTRFEKELGDFDEQWLKDDPSNGVFVSGKMKNNARKKMFLTMGAAMGFEDTMNVTPVLNSLDEGWPKDAEQFAAMMNNSRAGSYSRGKETQKGGVSFKVLLRAAGNMKIVDTDCGTTLGIHRTFDKNTVKKLQGREILTKKGWEIVGDQADLTPYVDQPIIVRSPMYCKLDGDNLCKHCAGQRLAQNPTGVSMALTNVSSIIMTDNLKIMHGSVLSTAKMDVDKTFS